LPITSANSQWELVVYAGSKNVFNQQTVIQDTNNKMTAKLTSICPKVTFQNETCDRRKTFVAKEPMQV